MYFPLLRGKQYELVALKEFAESHLANPWLCPIIEPVRVLPDALVRATEVLSRCQIRYSIILNPEQGDFAIATNRFEIQTFLRRFDGFDIRPIPAFYADGKSAAVMHLIEDCDLHDVMVVYENTFDKENPDVEALCNHNEVSYIVCGNADSRGNIRYLMRTGKNVIRLDDNFEVHKPNTAYRAIEEEPYTEELFYYQEEGFYGFSDYCVLPKEFAEGGKTPTAVAIHMTYRKSEDSLWVRHFVSDEAFDRQNIRNKFENAAAHLAAFYHGVEPTPAVQWLMENSGSYPGLGVLKKISMRNHIELVTNILPTLA